MTQLKENEVISSIRTPLNNLDHAGDLCSQLPTGGRQKSVAETNQPSENNLEDFINVFDYTYVHH